MVRRLAVPAAALKRVQPYLRLVDRPRRRSWIAVVAMSVVVGVVEAVAAVLLAAIVGMTAGGQSGVHIPVLGWVEAPSAGAGRRAFAVGIAAFFVCRGAIVVLQAYLQSRVTYTTGAHLARRLVHSYLTMPYDKHLRRNSAELIRNAYQAVGDIVVYAFAPLISLTSDVILVVLMATILLASAPVPTLIAAAVLALTVPTVVRIVKPRLRVLGEASQRTARESLQVLQQSFTGIREVKLHHAETYFTTIFTQSHMAYARTHYQRAALMDVPRVSIETVMVFWVLAFLVVISAGGGVASESVGLLGLFGYAVLRLLPAVNRIVASTSSLRFSGAAVAQVTSDLSQPQAAEDLSQPQAGEAFDGAGEVPSVRLERQLRLNRVSFRYGPAHPLVLRDVDFAVVPGEAIGIVGPTGSGKSTLLDLILGLLEPTFGLVTVDGVDIRNNLPAWHRTIGFVPQNLFVMDDTLRRNIALGIPDEAIDEDALEEALALAQLTEFVAALPNGLDEVLGERGSRVSGGQRQRIAIARALYRRPSVVMLDEATSALDAVTESQLMKALSTLRGDRTLIMVGHRIASFRPFDRIVVIADGSVVASGNYDDLLHESETFRLMAT